MKTLEERTGVLMIWLASRALQGVRGDEKFIFGFPDGL